MASQRMQMAHAVVLVLCAVFIAWNLSDEARQISSRADAIVCFGYWMVAPTVVAMIGNRSTHSSIRRANLGLNLFFMIVFTHYALNGSSETRLGAEHLHIILAPILLMMLVAVWLPALYLRVRIYRYVERRAAGKLTEL